MYTFLYVYTTNDPKLTTNCFTGVVPSDSVLESMVKETPSGSVNFTAFLSMFSDKLSGEYIVLTMSPLLKLHN